MVWLYLWLRNASDEFLAPLLLVGERADDPGPIARGPPPALISSDGNAKMSVVARN